MNIYIAGRTNSTITISEIAEVVESLEHDITFKWWLADEEQKWRKDEKLARFLAERERAAIWDADILILCYEEGLLGGLIETGIAIADDKDVFVIGADRESVFWNLDRVVLVKNIEELKAALKDYIF